MARPLGRLLGPLCAWAAGANHVERQRGPLRLRDAESLIQRIEFQTLSEDGARRPKGAAVALAVEGLDAGEGAVEKAMRSNIDSFLEHMPAVNLLDYGELSSWATGQLVQYRRGLSPRDRRDFDRVAQTPLISIKPTSLSTEFVTALNQTGFGKLADAVGWIVPVLQFVEMIRMKVQAANGTWTFNSTAEMIGEIPERIEGLDADTLAVLTTITQLLTAIGDREVTVSDLAQELGLTNLSIAGEVMTSFFLLGRNSRTPFRDNKTTPMAVHYIADLIKLMQELYYSLPDTSVAHVWKWWHWMPYPDSASATQTSYEARPGLLRWLFNTTKPAGETTYTEASAWSESLSEWARYLEGDIVVEDFIINLASNTNRRGGIPENVLFDLFMTIGNATSTLDQLWLGVRTHYDLIANMTLFFLCGAEGAPELSDGQCDDALAWDWNYTAWQDVMRKLFRVKKALPGGALWYQRQGAEEETESEDDELGFPELPWQDVMKNVHPEHEPQDASAITGALGGFLKSLVPTRAPEVVDPLEPAKKKKSWWPSRTQRSRPTQPPAKAPEAQQETPEEAPPPRARAGRHLATDAGSPRSRASEALVAHEHEAPMSLEERLQAKATRQALHEDLVWIANRIPGMKKYARISFVELMKGQLMSMRKKSSPKVKLLVDTLAKTPLRKLVQEHGIENATLTIVRACNISGFVEFSRVFSVAIEIMVFINDWYAELYMRGPSYNLSAWVLDTFANMPLIKIDRNLTAYFKTASALFFCGINGTKNTSECLTWLQVPEGSLEAEVAVSFILWIRALVWGGSYGVYRGWAGQFWTGLRYWKDLIYSYDRLRTVWNSTNMSKYEFREYSNMGYYRIWCDIGEGLALTLSGNMTWTDFIYRTKASIGARRYLTQEMLNHSFYSVNNTHYLLEKFIQTSHEGLLKWINGLLLYLCHITGGPTIGGSLCTEPLTVGFRIAEEVPLNFEQRP